eukprot:11611623-Alexandrium_andersonii.AAC.1
MSGNTASSLQPALRQPPHSTHGARRSTQCGGPRSPPAASHSPHKLQRYHRQRWTSQGGPTHPLCLAAAEELRRVAGESMGFGRKLPCKGLSAGP